MKVTFTRALSLTTSLSLVSAHSIFQYVYINDTDQGFLTGLRAPDSNYPVMDVTSNDLICNTNLTHFSDVILPVQAGSTIQAEWRHEIGEQPGGNPGKPDPDDPIAASHHGPIVTYLAKVDDALQKNVTGLEWFKIDEDGFDGTLWGVDRMVANNGFVNVTIPPCVPDGFYLMRHEIIALHSAYNYPGAQFYMECAQIQIFGGGGAIPSPTTSFPGAYSGSDPGILINIYDGVTNYTVPGPAVITC